jgi:hypothetical protein
MRFQLGNYRNLISVSTAIVLSLAVTTAASAATRSAPRDTPEWGTDVVRVTASQPGTLDVGPSGGGMEASGGSGDLASAARAARPRDTPLSVDYCVDLGPTDDSSGPYRVFFHLDTGGGDDDSSAKGVRRSKLHHRQPVHTTDVANLSFEIDTAVEMAVDTTGGDAFLGAIYDNTDTLVASDTDADDRLSVTLAAGTYTLVITGDGLSGDYVGQAGVGTCTSN